CAALLAVIAALKLLAERVAVPLPILLVIVGLLLALLPGLPAIHLDPQIVLLVFLPPIVYQAAVYGSWQDFRSNLGSIVLLAVGPVLLTTAAVAVAARHLFPGMGWGPAMLLGAVVAPSDEVAAISVMRRLKVPRRLAVILRGEGLSNDAPALAVYRIALIACVTDRFSVPRAAFPVAAILVGELLWGVVVGWLSRLIRSRARDPMVEVILSIITPFAAYVPADALGGSGVLPAVVAGLSLSSYVATGAPSATRLQSRPLWDVIAFVLNNLIFLLTGLQLRSVLGGVQQLSLPHLVAGGAVISVVVVIVRFAWVFSAVYIPRALRRRLRDPPPPWQHAFFIAWTGMRGGISLVAALGIPLIGAAGAPFPQRGLIIFVTSFVIFVTLVLQGLSLPVVIRWLNLTSDDTGAPATLRAQEYDARCRTAEAALAK